jgi:hypothetical protein
MLIQEFQSAWYKFYILVQNNKLTGLWYEIKKKKPNNSKKWNYSRIVGKGGDKESSTWGEFKYDIFDVL